MSGDDYADDEEDRSHDKAEYEPAGAGTNYLRHAGPDDETEYKKQPNFMN